MDNLKYQKTSYLHNDSDGVLNVVGTKHAWLKDGLIMEDSALKHISVTNYGMSTGAYLVINPKVSCVVDCEVELGFSIKRKYQTPGRGNEYPRNHMEAIPFFTKIAEEDISGGVIDPAALEDANLDLMLQIEGAGNMRDEVVAWSRKVGYVTGAPGDIISIEDSDGNSTNYTLVAGGGPALGGEIAVIDLGGNRWMFTGNLDHYYFHLVNNTAFVESQGIGIFGRWGEMHFDVDYIKNMFLSNLYYLQLNTTGTFASKIQSKEGACDYIKGADNAALVTALTTAGYKATESAGAVHATAADDKHFIGLVDLPVDETGAVVHEITRIKAIAGKGTWPVNRWNQLDLRFIGRYRMMHGVHENRPLKDMEYVVLQYVIEGNSSALSSGASSIEGFRTRYDLVVSFDAIKSDANLRDILSGIATC